MSEVKRYAVGVDIGGSHVCCCVVELDGMVILQDSIAHRPVDNKAGATQILNIWTEAVMESIRKSGVSPEGVGFAFPGPFDYEKGVSRIEGVNKFEHIFGLDVARSMQDRLRGCGIKQIRFVNDASAFALGECACGGARGINNVVVLTLGTGFGSGFIADCRLVTSGPRVPANGWVYCLPFEGGIADDAFSTRWFCKRYGELSGEQVEGAKQVAERIDSDPAAAQVFDEYGRRLASFVAPVCAKFGGEAILLGGNIARALSLFESPLTENLRNLGCRAEVRASCLHDRAAMTGAAALLK